MSSFYGFNLPLLPVIIFVSLIISYIIDKLVVAYYHRKPPLYDDTLNVVSIHLLKWAAFFYIAIAYWALTNTQLFTNYLKPIEYQAQIEFYEHYILEFPDTVQETIVLIVALLILLYCLVNFIFHIIEPLFQSTSEEDLMEFESLKPFSEALDQKALDLWVNEEKQIRQLFGYKYLFDPLFNKLCYRHNSVSEQKSMVEKVKFKNFISDATNYDFLYQNEYAHAYAYIPVSRRGDNQISDDSNFTRRALDFPYHKEEELAFEGHIEDTSGRRTVGTPKLDFPKRGITSVVV